MYNLGRKAGGIALVIISSIGGSDGGAGQVQDTWIHIPYGGLKA